MHQNPINNDLQNANIKPVLLELSQFKLALIITILCVLFFLIIQIKTDDFVAREEFLIGICTITDNQKIWANE
ncbi:MAG: hypothetical protein P8I88_00465 [Candidatus Thioglobus sp.]|nr:hypothetical protein [Candidatus Thioglobus sp.]